MILELLLIGLAAGVISGMLGVGGGVLFVPGLVFVLGFSQVDAEATSLLAIVPVGVVGAWRQSRHGNLRLKDGLTLGVLSALGALAGVALSNELSGRTLRLAFAALMLLVAATLVRQSLNSRSATLESNGT